MALARIITRSHACSRELALDLLSRGYTVEIVSPDAIPDDFADLELRVEEDPGNQLVATVEAHNDGRTSSLEFLHYLKAPMPDFVRRPMESGESPAPATAPAPSIGEPIVVTGESPGEVSRAADQAVIASPEIANRAEAQTGVISLSETHLLGEVPGELPIEGAAIAAVRMERAAGEELRQTEVPRPDFLRWRFTGRFWRTVLVASIVIALAALLAFGVGRNRRASTQSNAVALHEQTATVPEQTSVVNAVDSTKASANAAVQIPPSTISRQHGDEVVADNTVTYLDKRLAPDASTVHNKRRRAGPHLARHHRGHSRRGQIIAANKVTYLNKPAVTSAK